MSNTIFGIDLGTTYSAIAHINDFGQPEIIKNHEGDDTTASVVYFENATNSVVGKEAKNSSYVDPDNAVSLIKRHMGTEYPLQFHGNTFGPESISSLILKELVDYARQLTGENSNRVVITVPAYFGITEREATRQAGDLAGLEVVGIVTEPVAAALSLGIRGDKAQTLFIYDLGGGTFDTTVLTADNETLDVLVIDGSRQLGGADWDARLFDLVVAKFRDQAGLDNDPASDEDFVQDLLQEIEDKKKALSRLEKVSFRCRYGSADEKVEVARQEFEDATRDLVNETLEVCRRTLVAAQAKAPGLTVDQMLLVGGSSRMPMISNALRDQLGWDTRPTDFDLAVAKGAAAYGAAALQESRRCDDDDRTGSDPKYIGPPRIDIRNVLSRSIGVALVRENGPTGDIEEYVGFLAHTNDSLPISTTLEAQVFRDGATEIPVRLFQKRGDQESDRLEDNDEVTPESGAKFTDLPRLPAGSPIRIDVHVSEEGMVGLEAFEPVTGQRLTLDVRVAVMQAAEQEAAARLVAGISTRS